MIKEQICKAFCENLAVTEVPVGLAVKTPFKKANGDALIFYIVWEDETKSKARLEDDGETVANLEAGGVDFENENRKKTLDELLESYDAQFDEEEYLLYTDYYDLSDIPKKALKFASLLLRLQDFLLMMTKRQTEDTFRADLIAAIHERFDAKAVVEERSPYDDTMRDYVADVMIRPPTGNPLAIFIGTNEIRALEAILFGKEAMERKKTELKYMLVLHTAKTQKISDRTLTRAINTPNLDIAAFQGQKAEVLNKMEISMTRH